MALQIPLDPTDEAILRALQEDGRRSYRSIARDVGVAEGTVRARVRKLETLGALRVVAFVDPARLGNSVLALLALRCGAFIMSSSSSSPSVDRLRRAPSLAAGFDDA